MKVRLIDLAVVHDDGVAHDAPDPLETQEWSLARTPDVGTFCRVSAIRVSAIRAEVKLLRHRISDEELLDLGLGITGEARIGPQRGIFRGIRRRGWRRREAPLGIALIAPLDGEASPVPDTSVPEHSPPLAPSLTSIGRRARFDPIRPERRDIPRRQFAVRRGNLGRVRPHHCTLSPHLDDVTARRPATNDRAVVTRLQILKGRGLSLITCGAPA